MRQSDVQAAMRQVSSGPSGGAEKSKEVRNFDQAAFAATVARVKAEYERKAAAEARRQEELAAVAVADADVDLVAAALRVPGTEARRRLQERKGDVEGILRDAVMA